ncbi:hypothetical protein [Nocardioides furvisabuli]|uniref:hypothetical protein n=1 Tax=Nocardioides furvisabuli TaxID=375542 RepID=UPI001E335E6C|nr:hypothetical protein [Nocardioides furvisabuli]
MSVQDHFAGGGEVWWSTTGRFTDCSTIGRGVEVERGLGAGEVAEGLSAACVERQLGPEGLEGGSTVGEAWWRSKPSARSTSASSRTVPAKWTSWSWMVTWRGSTWR